MQARAARWDVFVSYSRADDAGPALAVARALERHGLRVFVDEHGVAPFQAISATILDALRAARVLLAYFSAAYPRRRACQHELTTAFLAGQAEGRPSRRVLVINPERDSDHIHPVQLRDAKHVPAPRSRRDLATVADLVTAHLADIDTPIGTGEPGAPPRWAAGSAPARPARFVGRLAELWRLHSILTPEDAPLTAEPSAPVAVVHGAPGIGKSTLVTEYLYRFHTAYPGGVVWCAGRDLLTDTPPAAPPPGTARSVRVVDDVPPGLDPATVAAALRASPGECGVITTRDARYTGLGVGLHLDGLAADDGTHLVTHVHAGGADADRSRATDLVRVLGGHPHALAVLARQEHDPDPLAAITLDRPTALATLAEDYLRVLDPLDDPAVDALCAIAALQPASTPTRVVESLLRQRYPELGAPEARRILRTLLGHGLLTSTSPIAAPPLLGHLIRAYHDPHRYHDVRESTLRLLVAQPAAGPEPTRPTAQEHVLAWKLQVEIAHRLAALPGADRHGSLRAALSSLHTLFDVVRDLLRTSGPPRPTPTTATIAAELLHRHLRPLLTTWHPRLLSHESTRGHADFLSHERQWSHYPELKAALVGLRQPLAGIIQDLATTTGSDYGLPSADRREA
ncbi:TIR domain-containing protein [Amycolatopsis arida]|uniref:TIR domain-containing protein n=1 Tax=Amycolatopsis arida TaxID=587909 RepID=A0A1I5MBL1_9PSEU|nr:TIR domain-containing protein [Amycolatopsis arida]TDX94022.1 TIR domain-containing protein [Amycolatopsis arida]SFP06336.1 TIR domain-containing protein [Amycolatopsis arida]